MQFNATLIGAQFELLYWVPIGQIPHIPLILTVLIWQTHLFPFKIVFGSKQVETIALEFTHKSFTSWNEGKQLQPVFS